MSAYDDALARFQADMAAEIRRACDHEVRKALGLAPPAHPLPKCKTCGDTGLVEDLFEGHGGLVFVTCPDCPTEPFPLP